MFVPLFFSGPAAAPLVRAMILMQNQGELVKSGMLSEPYKGIRDCFHRTIKNEGLLSLWRGNSASLLLMFFLQVNRFIFDCYIKKMVQFVKEEGSYWKRYVSKLVSACASEAYSHLFVYSLVYARIKLANDVKSGKKERRFKGLVDVYRITLKDEGFLGLYRGFGLACIHSFVYRALFFGLSDFLLPMVPVVCRKYLPLATGIAAVLGAYPIDTIHKRVLLSSGKHISSIVNLKQTASKEGLRSLFKGADANVLRILIGQMALRLYDTTFSS